MNLGLFAYVCNMPRFFVEVAYKGTAYQGFQVQDNASSVQQVVDQALSTLFRTPIATTGSSRTDAGVHALRNFMHFDTDLPMHPQAVYKLNAILPRDIVLNNLYAVHDEAHSRFDATYREYKYFVYASKNPFLNDRGYFFPYTIDIALMHEAAAVLKEYTDFESFSKRNSQVFTYNCRIEKSEWYYDESLQCWVYNVRANRFLRGMVRGLVATMLKVGRGKLSIADFRAIIEGKDCTRAWFDSPPQGLFLVDVGYPEGLLQAVPQTR
jgi:tRNA pseudouridine38-40 synthase